MKSKITLVILLVIIIFLGALSFYFGYEYFKTKDEVNALNSQVDILKKEQVLNESNKEIIENDENEVVETLSIPKFDSNKVDASVIQNAQVTNIEEIGYIEEGTNDFSYVTGPSQNPGFQVKYKGKEYILSNTANIIDTKNNRSGSNGTWYKVFLLDDGTIKYAFMTAEDNENTNLEIKDYNLKDVVALVNISYTTARGNYSRLGAITSDGVTHILITE